MNECFWGFQRSPELDGGKEGRSPTLNELGLQRGTLCKLLDTGGRLTAPRLPIELPAESGLDDVGAQNLGEPESFTFSDDGTLLVLLLLCCRRWQPPPISPACCQISIEFRQLRTDLSEYYIVHKVMNKSGHEKNLFQDRVGLINFFGVGCYVIIGEGVTDYGRV